MPIHAYFVLQAIMTCKEVDQNQTDLVFAVRSGFISRSVHARLQVYVHQLRFVPPDTQTDSILTRLHKQLIHLS